MLNNNKSSDFSNNSFINIFAKIGTVIDKMFSSNVFIVVVAILASISLYFYANGMPDAVNNVGTYTRVIENVKVEVIYDEETNVVDVYDTNANKVDKDAIYVDVILTGVRSDVLRVTNNEDYHFFIDASTLKDGETQQVEIQYQNISESISVDVRPSYYDVEFNKLQVRTDLTISPEIVNAQALGGNFSIEELSLNKNDVQISGSQKMVDQVASVKVLVDASIVSTAGEYTYGVNDSNVSLAAYDKMGQPVDVEISTQDLVITLKVSNDYKQVPIKYTPIGLDTLPEGKSIGELEGSVEFVNIYGAKDVISSIEYIEVEVNIEDFMDTNSKVYDVIKPEGVTSITKAESTSIVNEVSVKLNIEDTATKVITGVRVKHINIDDGLSVTAKDQSQSVVTVTLYGSQSVIDSITSEDIIAQVDVANLDVGEHTVEIVIVDKDTRVVYEQDRQRMVVVITKRD